MMALLATGTLLANASKETTDSLHTMSPQEMQEVVVQGVRVQKNAPFAVANIKNEQLNEFSKSGQELPFLFSHTPGVLAWSENGLGTGTTYMRIRGAADSRINVTIDGVPLNSPEDQCVFWANMNSYASLLGSVQIQRGVGTSTNGDGAFGGTIAMTTATPTLKPGAELSLSYGSFNTFNIGGKFSTGLLWNHLIFDGAYHETNTDGYIHGTSGRSGSYYGGLSWLGDGFTIRYKNIGNFEKTGQAWNGVTAGDDDNSLMDGVYGQKTGIKTYADLYNVGLGQYNNLYEKLIINGDGNYSTQRYKLTDGRIWEKATDNFWQNHNLLTGAFDLGEHLKASATLHYTHGDGYYKDLKINKKLSKYGIPNFTDSKGNTIKKSNFVRRKGIIQDAYGLVGNVSYQDNRWDIIGGLSLQRFKADHLGYLTYADNAELARHILVDDKYIISNSKSTKDDGNAYLKAAYHVTPQWQIFADAQYRYVGYKTNGTNDVFYMNEAGQLVAQKLDINEKYHFFNPKAGLSYNNGPHRAYASIAISHREPERNNFTDNFNYPYPNAEKLTDYEAGYQLSTRNFQASVNLYYMKYTDQFVQTGELSDIGEALTTNIKDSYRMGVELAAVWTVCPMLTIEGNAALSKNKIKDFNEVVATYDDDWNSLPSTVINYSNSTLAFSPSAIMNGFIDFHYNGFKAVWHTNYVTRQYLDNTENKDRSLPAYSFSNLSLSYTSKVKKVLPLTEVELGLGINNMFNAHYATSGYSYSAIVGKTHPNNNRYYTLSYVPMAGRTIMANLTLRF